MTLADIKSYTTAKLGLTDTTAQTMAETFAKQRWRMLWNEADWRQTRYQQTISVAAGTQDITLNTAFDAVKAVRWAGMHELGAINDISALAADPVSYDATGTPIAFIPLGRTMPGGALQIRLVRAPQAAGSLLVIGKRKPIELSTSTSDADNVQEVPIPGADACLCEFVMGDLYEWLRQFSKAEYYFRKAGILLETMKQIEQQQAAETRRIIPYVQQLDGDPATLADSLRPLG